MVFIFDRTKADVNRVIYLNQKYINGNISEEEKKEWNSNMKGALNLSDITRIENNIKTLASFFKVHVNVYTYFMGYIPKSERYYKRTLRNIKKLMESWFVFSDTPNIPTLPWNTYQKWNDIEKILHDLNYIYERYINGFNYCDTEIYTGEGIGLL